MIKDNQIWIEECIHLDRMVAQGDSYIGTVAMALRGCPSLVACAIEEFNAWRRGEGEYAFDENPTADGKNAEFPLSAKFIGIVFDVATRLIRNNVEDR